MAGNLHKLKEIIITNKKIVLWITAAILVILLSVGGIFLLRHNDDTDVVNEGTESSQSDVSETEAVGNPVMPGKMNAVYVEKTELTGGKTDLSGITAETDKVLKDIKDKGFNTVFLSLIENGQPVLITENGQSFNLAEYSFNKAHEAGLYVFVTVKASDLINADLTVRSETVKTLCTSYNFDGMMVTGFPELIINENVGGEKTETVGKAISDLRKSAVIARNNIFFGVLSEEVWANSETDSRGSETHSEYEMLKNSFDVLKWIEEGSVDFVCVNSVSSTSSSKTPFETVAAWWAQAVKGKPVKLYFSHNVNKLGSDDEGFKKSDEILKQLSVTEKFPEIAGSAYYSYSGLTKNYDGSTDVLIDYFKDEKSSDLILAELSVQSPKKLNVKTDQSTIFFSGSSDPKFSLKINGKEIERNDLGYFSNTYTLTPGANKFKVEHKGTVKNYTVTYERQLLRSVSPTGNVKMSGGSELIISAYALNNSSVYATINGVRVNLSPLPDQSGVIETGSEFSKYEGVYKVPVSTSGEKNIGRIVVYASKDGFTSKLTGAGVIVKATAKMPVIPNVDIPMEDGEPVDLLTPENDFGGEATNFCVISNNYAEVRPNSETSNNYNPLYTPLLEGTLDYFSSAVSYGDVDYYTTASGRRIKAEDVKIVHGNALPYNKVKVKSVTSDSSTDVVMQMLWKAPFNVTVGPQNYVSGFKINSFTAKYIDIKFSYTKAGMGEFDFEGSDVISKGEWITNGDNTVTLRLHLKRQNAFYGYNVYYDENSNLVFSFKNHNGASLNGKTIIVDAGHGCNDADGHDRGAAGSNPNYHEAEINLLLSRKVKGELEKRGAEVYMIRTDFETSLYLAERRVIARSKNPDALISIHCDASTSNLPFGTTAFYYNNFSYPFAKEVNKAVVNCYQTKIYTNGTPNNKYKINNGVKYYEFLATRIENCPSMLLETGFMTNPTEYALLITDRVQSELARAIADGIENYFRNR